MKTRNKIIIGIFVACLAVAAGIWMEVRTGRQMRAAVEQALEQNRNYETFTSDTIYLSPHSSPTSTPSPSVEGRGEAISLRDAVAYYRHPLHRLWTSSNDRLRAGYALGCVYRDLHEAPIAIITWEDAVAAADTTADDCDYATLYRVYGQMADIYFRQYMPEKQLEAQQKFCDYASLAGDTLYYISGLLRRNDTYLLLGDTTAVFDNIEYVRHLYLERGLTQEAAQVYPSVIQIALDRGHEHLAEFGLINMNARLYDPVTSCFLAPDPYVQAPDNSQSFNRYSYCLNNPLKYVDENGENPLAALFIGVGVGALIGAGTSALSYSISSAGNWHRQDFWRAVGIGAVSGAIGGAFGALGSMAGAGAIGNSIGYNFLSGTVNTVVTRSMFGQHLDWKDILPIMSASVIGSCFPSYGGVNGGWLANSAAEIGYNTLKGSTMGFAAGVTDAAIHHDNSRIWQNIAGGAVSGAARTMAIQLILGVKQDFNADSALPGFYRSGGLASLLPREWGLTLGNQSFVVSMSEQKTVLHEYFHLEQIRALGWANFYGRLIFEYIRDGFIGSYLKYLDLEWEAEIYSRFLMHETFENWEFRR